MFATGCAVGQIKHLLIEPGNAGGQLAAGFMPQARLRNQGICQLIEGFSDSPLTGGPLVPQFRTFVPDYVSNGFGLMDWQPDASAALKKDVPFFVRPAVRKRVEAMADSEGRSEIDLGFYLSAKQSMAPS